MKTIPSLPLTVVLWAVISSTMDGQLDLGIYVTPEDVPVRALDCRESFNGLTQKEKLYAHWMSEASWRGALICFHQVSAESPEILELVLRLGSIDTRKLRRAAERQGLTDQELTWWTQYAARFLSNTGNYLSFGDTKFIPRIEPNRLAGLIECAGSSAPEHEEHLAALWQRVRHKMYSLGAEERALGLDDKGTSAYYSENITQEDLDKVKKFLENQKLEAWNTRVTKSGGALRVDVASVAKTVPSSGSIQLRYGDFSETLESVNEAFEMAFLYAANENQQRMIRAYIDHFQSGDIDLHKTSQRWWVKDQGPAVETNIGFIETYRDPIHVRAEWEGLVAVVNREQSKSFQKLVEGAGTFLPLLPWEPAFEKDEFRKPDFTSLDVLAFANGGIPAGINIPNYDDIRMNDGFKNVSLGNVVNSGDKSTEPLSFLLDEDQELFRGKNSASFKVQVGLHELLGHGSGKLLTETEKGQFNFDRKVTNPFTKEVVKTWYKPGETWGSVFGDIASSYEECRAEAVGLYLCSHPDVLAIFGHSGDPAWDVVYVNWLSMARAGLTALPFYNPETRVWGQAHVRARFALLQVMLEAGSDFVRIEQDAKGDWKVRLDRSKIESVGRPAVGEFLKKLNVFKATADVARGRELYARYTDVPENFLKVRTWAIEHRKPRHIWVQPVTDLDHRGDVILREYPATYQGVIDSFVDRYAGTLRD